MRKNFLVLLFLLPGIVILTVSGCRNTDAGKEESSPPQIINKFDSIDQALRENESDSLGSGGLGAFGSDSSN